MLKDGTPTPSKAIKSAAREVGYAWRTVHRAAKRIGVRIKKDGMSGGWFWSLPKMPHGTEDAEHANFPNVAPSAPSASSVAPSADTEAF